MIQSVSNGYYGYQNIAPMQNTAYNAPMFAMQPQQPSADTVQFKGQQPEEESFVSRNLGKIILGGLAVAATAYFTHGKLWGKAEKAAGEVAENTAKGGKKAAEGAAKGEVEKGTEGATAGAAEGTASKGAEEVGEKGAGAATQEGSVANNTGQIKSEQINEATTQTTASSKPVVAVIPKTREQLGVELAELAKENERKAYINRGQISKMYSDAELSAQFDAKWELELKSKSTEAYRELVETIVNNCANGGNKSFGSMFSVGWNSPSAPTFMKYAELIADEMGYKMTNFKKGRIGDIQFDFNKK